MNNDEKNKSKKDESNEEKKGEKTVTFAKIPSANASELSAIKSSNIVKESAQLHQELDLKVNSNDESPSPLFFISEKNETDVQDQQDLQILKVQYIF